MRFSVLTLSTSNLAQAGRALGTLAKVCLASAGVLLSMGDAVAQTAPITRTITKRADISIPQHEVVILRVEVLPGGEAGWHTHPGDEAGYVNEGEVTLLIAGQPPRKYVAGEAFLTPAGVVHNGINHGATATKLISMLITEKGKPLSSPAAVPQQ